MRVVGYVPDAGHKRLIELCQTDKKMRAVVLSTEEEGIGLAAGAWLGGQKSALLMQSSGVGNIVNVLGMVRECRFPLVTLVTMRGEQGEFNPWQVPMGQAVRRSSRRWARSCSTPTKAEESRPSSTRRCASPTTAMPRSRCSSPQRLIGIKSFQEQAANEAARRGQHLLLDRGELLVVAGLGSTAWDCTAAGDSPLTFPMWGAMGQAAMMGLGLALAQPQRRVLVITGDGEVLMGSGLSPPSACSSRRI